MYNLRLFAFRLFFAGLLGLLVGGFEIFAQPFFPALLEIRPVVPFLVLLVVSSKGSRAICAGVGAGILVDLYALPVWDFALLRFSLLVWFAREISQRWLTNRSLYSILLLALFMRGLERLFAWMIRGLMSWGDRVSYAGAVWNSFVTIVGWDMVLVIMGFLVFAFFTRRFYTTVRTV